MVNAIECMWHAEWQVFKLVDVDGSGEIGCQCSMVDLWHSDDLGLTVWPSSEPSSANLCPCQNHVMKLFRDICESWQASMSSFESSGAWSSPSSPHKVNR